MYWITSRTGLISLRVPNDSLWISSMWPLHMMKVKDNLAVSCFLRQECGSERFKWKLSVSVNYSLTWDLFHFFHLHLAKWSIHVKFLNELPNVFGSHVNIVWNGQILHACELFIRNECKIIWRLEIPSFWNNTSHTVSHACHRRGRCWKHVKIYEIDNKICTLFI